MMVIASKLLNQQITFARMQLVCCRSANAPQPALSVKAGGGVMNTRQLFHQYPSLQRDTVHKIKHKTGTPARRSRSARRTRYDGASPADPVCTVTGWFTGSLSDPALQSVWFSEVQHWMGPGQTGADRRAAAGKATLPLTDSESGGDNDSDTTGNCS
jgi:hypothetical protein